MAEKSWTVADRHVSGIIPVEHFKNAADVQQYACTYCGGIPKEPWSVVECGEHIYCDPCKQDSKYKLRDCAACNMEPRTYRKIPRAQRMILKARICCPLCAWDGPAKDYEAHQFHCSQMECSECGTLVSQMGMTAHQASKECFVLRADNLSCHFGCEGKFTAPKLARHKEEKHADHVFAVLSKCSDLLQETVIKPELETQRPTEESLANGVIPPAYISPVISQFIVAEQPTSDALKNPAGDYAGTNLPKSAASAAQLGPDKKLVRRSSSTVTLEAREMLRDRLRAAVSLKRISFLESVKQIIEGSLLVSQVCTTLQSTDTDDMDLELPETSTDGAAAANSNSSSNADLVHLPGSEGPGVLSLPLKIKQVEEETAELQDILYVLREDVIKLQNVIVDFEHYKKETMKEVGEFEAKVMQLDRMGNIKEDRLRELTGDLKLAEDVSYDGVMLWKVDDIRRKLTEARNGRSPMIYSPPFYNKRGGYKACASLHFLGQGDSRGSTVALFLVMMKGANDILLKWPPPKVEIKLSILDQSPSRDHQRCVLHPDVTSIHFARPEVDKNVPIGNESFLSVSELGPEHTVGRRFVKDDKMFVKVEMDLGVR